VAPPRNLPWLRGLNKRTVSAAVLAGAGLAIGFIQLMATPLRDVSAVEVQVLAVRTTVFVAPLTVSLLQLLQQCPLLLEEADLVASSLQGGWRLRLASVGGMALCSAILMLYFQAAALIAAVLSRPESDAVAELHHLSGTINPLLLLLLLLKAALFGAIAAGLTLQQGLRELRKQRYPARRMADSVLVSITVLLIIDLTLVVVLDPLRIGANG